MTNYEVRQLPLKTSPDLQVLPLPRAGMSRALATVWLELFARAAGTA